MSRGTHRVSGSGFVQEVTYGGRLVGSIKGFENFRKFVLANGNFESVPPVSPASRELRSAHGPGPLTLAPSRLRPLSDLA